MNNYTGRPGALVLDSIDMFILSFLLILQRELDNQTFDVVKYYSDALLSEGTNMYIHVLYVPGRTCTCIVP